jgi:hypothetical protein
VVDVVLGIEPVRNEEALADTLTDALYANGPLDESPP